MGRLINGIISGLKVKKNERPIVTWLPNSGMSDGAKKEKLDASYFIGGEYGMVSVKDNTGIFRCPPRKVITWVGFNNDFNVERVQCSALVPKLTTGPIVTSPGSSKTFSALTGISADGTSAEMVEFLELDGVKLKM